jgi:two-component system cell cycle sensor histidine kinase/response regulator CckA
MIFKIYLPPVSMSIELLKDDFKDEKQLNILNAVEESAKSGIKLIKTILTLGKGVKSENVIINMNSLLHKIVDSFMIGLPGNIHFENEYDFNNFSVVGDSSQLQQVFLNLLINARDAMPGGGTITLRAELLKNNEYSNLKNSQFSVIEVSDTGIGIKDADLEKIFDPFFTTKNLTKSTGIGLSIVQNIIKNHDGYIEVESIVDYGSKFRVYLPLAN